MASARGTGVGERNQPSWLGMLTRQKGTYRCRIAMGWTPPPYGINVPKWMCRATT
jgi:hypothetical protein